jgi:hypothetical protein
MARYLKNQNNRQLFENKYVTIFLGYSLLKSLKENYLVSIFKRPKWRFRMQSEWLLHNDKKIFFINLADMDMSALEMETEYIEKVLSVEPEHSVLLMTDIRGFVNSEQALKLFERTLRNINKYVHKQTLIGMKGIKEIADANNDIHGKSPVIFEDMTEAADWLLADN